MDKRKARQRTAIAVTASLGGHAIVLFLIMADLDRGPRPSVIEPTVYVSLESLAPPPPPPSPSTPASSRSPQEPRASAARPASPSAVAALPAARSAEPALAPAGSGESAAASPQTAQGLRAGCIGKRGQSFDERIDCKLDLWAFLDGKPRRELPGDDIPADKKAAYDLVAQRQAAQRRPIARMGNGASMGCAYANYGTGCLDDMLIPLTGSQARANRSGASNVTPENRSGLPSH